MKYSIIIVIAISLMIVSSSCKKDRLPEPTQTGRNTFGCLINGVLFKPKGSVLKGSMPDAQYGYRPFEAGFTLEIDVENKVDDHLKTMHLYYTSEVELKSGMTIPINSRTMEAGFASYTDYADHRWVYNTTEQAKGELKILHFDKVNRIVSGTFWFDAVNKELSKVEVREGRFDIKYY